MPSKKLSDQIGQFTTIPNVFISSTISLTTEAKWLFVILRYHSNFKTGHAFPSYTAIQEMTGFHRRTIAQALRELETSGWLTKQRRFGQSTVYSLQIPSSSISDTTDASYSSSTVGTISSSTYATISSSNGVHANKIDLTRSKEQDTPLPPKGERRRGMISSRVLAVFEYWQRRLNHPQAKLDGKRARLIQARLRDYTVEELKRAIEGCAASPFHMGQNDTGQVHDDIALICRDASHVEMFTGKLNQKALSPNDPSLDFMTAMGIEWKPRHISTPEEYAALSGQPVEEVRAKWS